MLRKNEQLSVTFLQLGLQFPHTNRNSLQTYVKSTQFT